MKIYTAPQSEPDFTTLQATVSTWRTLLGLRPVPHNTPIFHVAREGQTMPDNSWISTANVIARTVKGKDDDEVVRLRFRTEIAAAVVEMARG